MKRHTLIILFVFLLVCLMNSGSLLAESSTGHGHHDEHIENPTSEGPHGGRLLEEDGFAIEITVFEHGLPPEFRVYAYLHGKLLSPKEVEVNVELTRLGGQVDQFRFTPQGDYLRGKGIVAEPHSFNVHVSATYNNQFFHWAYDSFEGQTQIDEKMAAEVGIKTETVGPITIKETLVLTGRVQTDPNRLARVFPRFPGVVKTIKRHSGEQVKSGDTLATIQSNESMQTYSLNAPINGQIVQSNIRVGEVTGDEALFVIIDPSSVWVTLDVFAAHRSQIKEGQTVEVETLSGQKISGIIDWISPLTRQASQSVSARVMLLNPEGVLSPGQRVKGHVNVANHTVPIAVRISAIQRFRDFQVVFARFDDTYEVRMLDLGRRDNEWVEVLNGIAPNTEYVTENSYLIKADIEKSGASHDH